MLIKCIPVGNMEANCYVVTDEKTLLCAVIDPGDESNVILDYLEDNKLRPSAIFLTHGHYDHTGAVETVRKETGADVWIHKLDVSSRPEQYRFYSPDPVRFYREGDVIKVGSLDFTIYETPGHSPGSVTIKCGDALFTGDTLFRASCGRTDLPGGDMAALMASLRRLGNLPGNYEVWPGHMDPSTLDIERASNMYMEMALR